MPEPIAASSPNLPAIAKGMGDKFRAAQAGTIDAGKSDVATPDSAKGADTKGIPAPFAPEKKVETKPDPKQNDKEFNFKALRGEFDEFRTKSEKRIAELQSERDNIHNSWTKEKSTLEAQLKEYQEIVSRTALEHDPRFKSAFDSRLQTALTEAKDAVGTVKAIDIEAAFNLPEGEARDKKVREIAADLEDFDKVGLRTAYDNFKRAQRERKAELDKARDNLKGLEVLDSKQQEAKRAERNASLNSLFNTEIASFAKSIPDFSPSEKDEAHNATVKDTIERAKQWLSSDLQDADLVRLVLWASKGYNAIGQQQALQTELAKLADQVQKLSGAQPTVLTSGRQPARDANGKFVPNSIGREIASKYKQAMESGVPAPQS